MERTGHRGSRALAKAKLKRRDLEGVVTGVGRPFCQSRVLEVSKGGGRWSIRSEAVPETESGPWATACCAVLRAGPGGPDSLIRGGEGRTGGI